MTDLRRLLDPVNRKLRMLAGRAVLALLADAVKAQVKALDGEIRDESELFQQYGFRSRPLPGAEGVLLSLGGNRDHTIIVCMDDRRYQLDLLADGEAAMYTDEGDHLIMRRGRITELVTETFRVNAGTAIELNTKTVTINASESTSLTSPTLSADLSDSAQFNTPALNVSGGDVSVSGTITAQGDVLAGSISLKNHKTKGVQPGSGVSQGPI